MPSLERAFDYKFYWGRELERRKSLGITEPEPIPHPDDVLVNPRTGKVTIVGPWTKEEKAALDSLHNEVEELDRDIERLTAQIKIIRIKKVREHVERQIADKRSLREMIVAGVGEPNKRRRR